MSDAHRSRLEALRARLDPGLEALLVSNPSNIFYLSGFTGSAGLLLVGRAGATLYSDFRYRLQAAEQAPAVEFVEVERGLVKGAGEKLAQSGLARVGYDQAHLTCQSRETLSEAASGVAWLEAAGVVEELRLVKSGEEIERMRRAAELADRALAHLVTVMKPGAKERDLALEAEFLMRRAGAEAAAFKVIVGSGPHGALPHAEVTERELQAGDLVVLDLGARLEGYCSDVTRTFAVGEACRQARDIYALVYRAQRAALAAVRAGAVGREVDAVARTLIAEAGYGEAFGHGLGHGVGIEVHEGPRLAREVDAVLAAGNVVTVEPGIYLEGFGGVRLEDMVAVTEDGSVTLTSYPMAADVPIL